MDETAQSICKALPISILGFIFTIQSKLLPSLP